MELQAKLKDAKKINIINLEEVLVRKLK